MHLRQVGGSAARRDGLVASAFVTSVFVITGRAHGAAQV